MGHLFFCSRTCFGELRGAEILPSHSLQQDLESVVSVHSCSEKTTKKLIFNLSCLIHKIKLFFFFFFFLFLVIHSTHSQKVCDVLYA